MHLQSLLAFLSHSPFSSSDAYRRAILAPFEMQQPHAWARLFALLSRLMLRSSKLDMEQVGTIPGCTMVTTTLTLNRDERRAYNSLVLMIRRNIILASGPGSDVDSLLHTKNQKQAREVCLNTRKACCVTGQHKIAVVKVHVEECIADMRRGHSLQDEGCQCNGVYYDVKTLKQVSKSPPKSQGSEPTDLGNNRSTLWGPRPRW